MPVTDLDSAPVGAFLPGQSPPDWARDRAYRGMQPGELPGCDENSRSDSSQTLGSRERLSSKGKGHCQPKLSRETTMYTGSCKVYHRAPGHGPPPELSARTRRSGYEMPVDCWADPSQAAPGSRPHHRGP